MFANGSWGLKTSCPLGTTPGEDTDKIEIADNSFKPTWKGVKELTQKLCRLVKECVKKNGPETLEVSLDPQTVPA